MVAPLARPARRALLLAGPLVCAGCLPFFVNGGDGSASQTVDGELEWVTSVVASVFREAGMPVVSAASGAVHTGAFWVEDPWGGGYLGARVACGDDGDVPLDGEVVELRVDAYIVDASVHRPEPEGVLPVPPSATASRTTGHRSRVVVNSEGWTLNDESARCRLRPAFASELIERVAARTSRRDVVAEGAARTGDATDGMERRR